MNQDMSNLEDYIIQNNINLIKENLKIKNPDKFQNHNDLN
jgi:hypothetical protein